jgi:DNA-binding NarL/FixJ family response regulator
LVEAVRAGAIGCLLKDAGAYELRCVIKAAASGQAQLSSPLAARLIRMLGAPRMSDPLTERDIEVLSLLARGYSNKEIATIARAQIATGTKPFSRAACAYHRPLSLTMRCWVS